MKKKIKPFFLYKRLEKEEKGSVVVLFALAMVVFLVFFALVADGGNLYAEKRKLQKSADFSALAGVQNLPQRPDKAHQAAVYTAEQNNLTSSKVSFNSTNTIITVEAEKTVPLFFANTLGFSDPKIQVRSKARIAPLTSRKGVIPLGVQSTFPLSFGTRVKLKVGPADTSSEFGALALSGTGASNYEHDLTYGYSSAISVGQTIPVQTGNIAGPTQKAIQKRMMDCPYHGAATYLDYPDNCPLVVAVPVYQNNGSGFVKVVGFASFFLESVGPINEGSPIIGRFLRSVYQGESSDTNADFGAYSIKLVK